MQNTSYTLLFVLTLSVIASIAPAEQTVVGWVEQVGVNGDFFMHAKIDSGADNSSLNLLTPHYYEQGNTRRVSFRITNREGQSKTFDQPIIKTTLIKTKEGHPQQRDVIELSLCLGMIKKTVNVNLVNRNSFNYQLLVGRNFLSPDFVIDPSRKYLVKANCHEEG